jgi:sensor histidine kinase regulating citrate/malate metabolism
MEKEQKIAFILEMLSNIFDVPKEYQDIMTTKLQEKDIDTLNTILTPISSYVHEKKKNTHELMLQIKKINKKFDEQAECILETLEAERNLESNI